ncbi:porin [soil metagenome]
MKKRFFVLCVLGAAASAVQAQSNVALGGVVYANLKSYRVGNTTRAAVRELRVDDDFNSRFWVTGSEELGGGNSAIFYIENRLNTDVNNVQGTANGVSNGDTWVGLKGRWGQLTVGKHVFIGAQGVLSEFVNAAGGSGYASLTSMPTSMLGTLSILDQFAGGYIDASSRTNNSIKYTSPDINGLTAIVGMSTASAGNEGTLSCTGAGVTALVTGTGLNPNGSISTNTTPTCPQLTVAANAAYSDGRQYFLQGFYRNGPLLLTVGYRNNTVEGRIGADDRQARFSGFYTLATGLKIGGQLDRVSRIPTATGVSASRFAWAVPVSYQIGRGIILASYNRAGDYNGVANSGARMTSVGYDYALSKRTNLGIHYSKLSNDSGAAYQPFLAGSSFSGSGLLAGESATTLALGLKHVF